MDERKSTSISLTDETKKNKKSLKCYWIDVIVFDLQLFYFIYLPLYKIQSMLYKEMQKELWACDLP